MFNSCIIINIVVDEIYLAALSLPIPKKPILKQPLQFYLIIKLTQS